jgi:Nif-specific regulatory protein
MSEASLLPEDEYRLLFDIARAFDRHVDLKPALLPVLSLMESRAGLCWGMVTLLDRMSGLLKIEEASGLDEREKARGVYRLGEGLIGRVFESGIAITVGDLSCEPRFLNRAKRRSREDMAGTCFYCVPIRSGKSVIGTLSAERRVFESGDDLRTAQMAHDNALLEKVAQVISDSAKLRERIIEENFRIGNREEIKRYTAALYDSGEEAGGFIAPGSKIIGRSMGETYELLKSVSPSDATVLITGESGTGKELFAAEIQRLSRRSEKPYIKINCAALPESIIESELFGHEKGAFTGALSMRKGRFEMAQGGTLFLDEIGELSQTLQVKLLRVLQEREIERVGGMNTIKVDVRLIAATNRNLEDEVKAGRLREDLYYRLNVFPIHIPPLRDRKGDILLLADHFSGKYAEKNGKLIKRFSSPALDLLSSHNWPGNVRELENVIERAVILSTDGVIHSYNLPPSLQSAASTHTEPTATLEAALSRLENEMIVDALKIEGGNMAAASRRLGISERQMGLRVRHYGIDWHFYRVVSG